MVSENVQQAIDALDSDDAVVRGRAIETLMELGLSGLADRLRPLLEDRDWVVRFKAASALAWLGDESGVEVLLDALRQRDLCFMALQSLTELGSAAALEGIRNFSKRRFLHPLERLQAAAAMFSSGDESSLLYIEQRTLSSKPEERGLALELLGRLSAAGALDRLQAVLANPDDPQRMDALRGLAALDDRKAQPLLERVASEQEDEQLAKEAQSVLSLWRKK